MLFDTLIRPAMYRLCRDDAELVHNRTVTTLARLGRSPGLLRLLQRYCASSSPTSVLGLRFPNPVGLAAGMDKDGLALPAWPALGFGFVEAGTVTRFPQAGNPTPRLYHLAESDAVLNRMGFNNAGSDALAERLATDGKPPRMPLGISIGKSKVTELTDAVSDYQHSFRVLYPYADYFAVNVSSPNTPGLRGLQDRAALDELLTELQSLSNQLAGGNTPTPLLVKVSPDLPNAALTELLQVCTDRGVAGLIATNTTLDRSGLAAADAVAGQQPGGVSGRPVRKRALEVVRLLHEETGGTLPIIGVGGIMTADDARRMFDAGASLIQLYSGFALHGPGLLRAIGRHSGARP